uniref:Uncharacterized protein n=1 Tax=Ascaris lumbricoides TaxID=6252 RepID=A0A0M3HM82_ASCLU
MNNHQSLKAEIDAREENFNICISLGRDLLNRKHYASSEIEKKLIKLTTERAEMMRRWEDRWEYLQLSELSSVLLLLIALVDIDNRRLNCFDLNRKFA